MMMVCGVVAYEPYDVLVIDGNDDYMCNAYMDAMHMKSMKMVV